MKCFIKCMYLTFPCENLMVNAGDIFPFSFHNSLSGHVHYLCEGVGNVKITLLTVLQLLYGKKMSRFACKHLGLARGENACKW